ncbi:MAG: heat-inducible transcriptional repressor HrcA [Dialister sp.]|nr:heat-inducible transcriptional repressor HrcA [Dialister sp.]
MKQNNDPAPKGGEELNERKRQVLWAIVQDYAETAEPVGSRTIARKYHLGVSSATIRNEMQDLEDEGYLEQPHTSAGRVPSIKGYRFYVDWLMQPEQASEEEKQALEGLLLNHVSKVDEIFRDMARIVAALTHTLSVATSSVGQRTLNYVRFLPLDEDKAILVAVTEQGDVTHTVVAIPQESSFDEMQLLADKMNHFLHGKVVSVADEKMILSFREALERDLSLYMPLFTALQEAMRPSGKMYAGGAAQLIEQPEFQNVEKMQSLLNLLEQRDILQSLLLSSNDQPIAVHIGSENKIEGLDDVSIVRAQFSSGGRVVGSVAVLGPTRMQYSRIIGMMRFMQQRIDRLLKGNL